MSVSHRRILDHGIWGSGKSFRFVVHYSRTGPTVYLLFLKIVKAYKNYSTFLLLLQYDYYLLHVFIIFLLLQMCNTLKFYDSICPLNSTWIGEKSLSYTLYND